VLQIESVSKIPAWNCGGSMIAALASNCRQSDQAIQFLQWIRKDQTRNALQGVMLGVDSKTAPAGADQLSWRVKQQQLGYLNSESIPLEPSLPMANEFRLALGQALLEFLRGRLPAEEALMKAQRGWEAITRRANLDLRNEYEKSLGLTL
jgi:ABC-type glycerol-3-phosphate transport system substrate-binding protein